MATHRFAALTLLFTLACHTAPSAKDAPNTPADVAWLLGPTEAEDLVGTETTEDSLRAKFGAAQVRHDSIYVGEATYLPGVVLFPDDSTRRVEILWADTLARAYPAVIIVRTPGSHWQVYPGIGIGTSLGTVDSLNGGPIELSGFGSGYSGGRLSYLGGRLDTLWREGNDLGRSVLLRFEPTLKGYDSLTPSLAGEGGHRSDEPMMKRALPQIREMLVRTRRGRGKAFSGSPDSKASL